MDQPADYMRQLLALMSQLRDPKQGCPWDKKQSFASLVSHTIEEAYEVADVIERQAWRELPAELADLLYQIIFYCQLGQEQGWFDFPEVAAILSDKLIDRHPHVFQSVNLVDPKGYPSWEEIKKQERTAQQQTATLANIPNNLPALTRALKIQKRVAQVGFDWPTLAPVVDKVREELREVLDEVTPQMNQDRVKEEVGDLLFAVTNLARHLQVDPETALRYANKKFENRFTQVENLCSERDTKVEDTSIETLEILWQKVKRDSDPC